MLVRQSNLIAVLLSLALHDAVLAQNGPPAAKHLQPIESFIGVWEARFDPPGSVPEGDLQIQFRWMGNKSYVQSSVNFHPDGAPDEVQMNPEFTVIGYSEQESKTKAWLFKYATKGEWTLSSKLVGWSSNNRRARRATQISACNPRLMS